MPVRVKRSEDRVYTKAIVNLLASDLKNIQEYLLGTNISFRNHVNDKKGNLISCEAYFVRWSRHGMFGCRYFAFFEKNKMHTLHSFGMKTVEFIYSFIKTLYNFIIMVLVIWYSGVSNLIQWC